MIREIKPPSNASPARPSVEITQSHAVVYLHRAYGLEIRSVLPLPELGPGVAPHDVTVSLVSTSQTGSIRSYSAASLSPIHDAALHWEGVGRFFVRDGKEIVIQPAPETQPTVLRTFLLGPVLAILLRQRGLLVLHASAVAVNGQAFLFMGGSGWGKSTLAAALYRQGGRLLSDDVTAIDLTGTEPTVIPGYPQLKLWPDSVAVLGLDPEGLPRLHALSDKRVYRDPSRLCDRPVPLGGVCVLAQGADSQIDPLDPQSAIVELIRHSSRVRELHPSTAPTHLAQCAKLASIAPISRLTLPRSFEALSGVVTTLAETGLHASA